MENKLRKVFLFLPAVVIVGTIGFKIIEGWDLIDSLYMTIITMATIGFHEVHPLSYWGKLFTIFFVIFGVFPSWGFIVSFLFNTILDGHLQKILGSRKMIKKIGKLKGHYIVCGFGRVGSAVCGELAQNNIPFVVIERAAEMIELVEKNNYFYIKGSSSDDENLKIAGIERATALINTVAEEADAVYITLSARQLNPDLFIISRADNDSVYNKLLRAGATKVISPHIAAGVRMAQAAIKPAVVDFMTVASGGADEGMRIEEIAVKSGSKLEGTILKDSGIRSELGITVIAAKKKGVEMYNNPPPDFYIEAGDTLILVGTSEQLEQLVSFCSA
ncbi:MAG: potassium channel protein [candidate division Zixibacteria bacterium]|nr:potassium channel protein [candidate division Zixibacteria bacterium]